MFFAPRGPTVVMGTGQGGDWRPGGSHRERLDRTQKWALSMAMTESVIIIVPQGRVVPDERAAQAYHPGPGPGLVRLTLPCLQYIQLRSAATFSAQGTASPAGALP